MTNEELRDVLDRGSRRLFNDGDTSGVEEFISESMVDHDPLPGQPEGREGTRWKVDALFTAFPDFQSENVVVLADGEANLAAHMYVSTGTNTGSFLGAPPTNKTVRLVGIDILRFDSNGKVVERWGQIDMLSVMRQLGLLPADDWSDS